MLEKLKNTKMGQGFNNCMMATALKLAHPNRAQDFDDNPSEMFIKAPNGDYEWAEQFTMSLGLTSSEAEEVEYIYHNDGKQKALEHFISLDRSVSVS